MKTILHSSVAMPKDLPVTKTQLPWNGLTVDAFDLYAWLTERLGHVAARYLPHSITVYFERETLKASRLDFLDEVAAYLVDELERRRNRGSRFLDLGLFRSSELDCFLTDRTKLQPWALFYSERGGLGVSDLDDNQVSRDSGVIPCSTMRNHGVAWNRSESGKLRVCLATAPKPGSKWDFDSDIGHESAHAAFAPVPLFVQPPQGADALPLSRIRCVRDLEPAHIARICYVFSEIAVVAVRGESRPTDTCLPVADREELFAVLALANEIVPDADFGEASRTCHRVHGVVRPNEGIEVFEIAAPIMRCIPRLSHFVDAFDPPSLDAFVSRLTRSSK